MIQKKRIVKLLKKYRYKISYTRYHKTWDILKIKYFFRRRFDEVNTDKHLTVKIKKYVVARFIGILKNTKTISVEDIQKLRECFVFYQLPHKTQVTTKLDEFLKELP